MTVLFTNPLGIKFERTDYKNRSKVKVHNNSYNLRTYRFKNVECFESPYISWENLDQCGGWAHTETYAKTAVQNGTKLFTSFVHEENECFEGSDEIVVNTKKHWYSPIHRETTICRKGCLADYYDIEAIFEHYSDLDVEFTEKEINDIYDLVYDPIWTFATDKAPFDYSNCRTDVELVITGLLLGYPLESTASIIQGY